MTGKKIMTSEWINSVWKLSATDNIPATHEQFDKYRVPTFYNLAITTTGLSKGVKKQVQDLVEQNGGKYYGEFAGSKINIVIAKKDSAETPKLKAAMTANIDCLAVEWIFDSDAKGSALPLGKYRILIQAKKITSTPEKGSPFNATVASVELSGINNATINETANSSQLSDMSENTDKDNSLNADSTFKETVDKLNVKDAKKAGNFLDGCNVRHC